jgi:hypothetical protein
MGATDSAPGSGKTSEAAPKASDGGGQAAPKQPVDPLKPQGNPPASTGQPPTTSSVPRPQSGNVTFRVISIAAAGPPVATKVSAETSKSALPGGLPAQGQPPTSGQTVVGVTPQKPPAEDAAVRNPVTSSQPLQTAVLTTFNFQIANFTTVTLAQVRARIKQLFPA